MRIVMPTAGEPVAPVPADAELVPLEADTDYSDLFERLWRSGDDFVIVEHDIVAGAHVFSGFEACEESYCGHYYRIGRKLGGTLGCVRFRGEFTQHHATVADEVRGVTWQKLDGAVAAALLNRGYADFHVHEPPVVHLREYESGKPTSDPTTVIEEQRPGYVRYRSITDGRRWEVHGTCDRRGDCIVGAVIEGYGEISDHKDIARAKKKLGRDRIDSEMDVPVTPEFKTCCGSDIFTYVEL